MYIQDVSFLVIVRTAIQKGEKDGLLMLLGKRAVEMVGKQARAKQAGVGGRGKKGYEGPLKQTLRVILAMTEDKTLEGVLHVMSDTGEMDRLAYPVGGGEGTPLCIMEVNNEQEKVLYLDMKTQAENSTSFKNISNIIPHLIKQ